MDIARKITALIAAMLFSAGLSALEPTPGMAIVDGLTGDWNLDNDASVVMCEAGKVDFETNQCTDDKEHLSTAYFRYECNSETLFILVLMEGDNEADVNSEAWLKVYNLGNNVQVSSANDNGGTPTGNPPEFSWVPPGATNAADGFEASFGLEPGSYDIEVHVNSNGRTSSTGRPGPLLLTVPCDPRPPSANPSIDVEKSTNGLDADAPGTGPELEEGDAVTWSYLVTNTGDVTLVNIDLQDDHEGTITCPKSTLEPAEEMTCTHNGTAGSDDYDNLATVTGLYDGDPPEEVSDNDPSRYTVVQTPDPIPAIDIEKSTNGFDADVPKGPSIEVDGAVNWEYEVTNTGETDLINVTVNDDQGVTVTCPQDTLAIGESMTCTANGTATEGQYANIGSVMGSFEDQIVSDNDPSHYFGVRIELDVEKHTQGHDADQGPGPVIEVGDTVYWSVFVTNTGNVALTDVIVTDDTIVAQLDCAATGTNVIPLLPTGETVICQAIGTAEAIEHANTATACGDYIDSFLNLQDCDDDPSHYTGADPGIDVEKATNGSDSDVPFGEFIFEGEDVTWTYVVTNTGNIALFNVTLNDNILGDISCPQDTLDVAESMECEYTGGIAMLGQYANLAKATGEYTIVTCTDPDTCFEETRNTMDTDPSHYYGFVDNQPSLELFGLDFVADYDPELGLGYINGSFIIQNASGGPEVIAIGIEEVNMILETRTRATKGKGWDVDELFGNCTFNPAIPTVLEGPTGSTLTLFFSCSTMTQFDVESIKTVRVTACVDIFNREKTFCTKESISAQDLIEKSGGSGIGLNYLFGLIMLALTMTGLGALRRK